MWGLQLQPNLTWFRSTMAGFPLIGAARFSIRPCVTPRPHKRAEIFIFGGHLEAVGSGDSEVLDAFFTLDMRSWHRCESEVPRESWSDVEARLRSAGKDETDIDQARSEWEEEQLRKQKEIDRANRRKVRRGIFRSQKSNKDAVMLAAGGGKQKVVSARERISDDDETAERDAEKVRALALQLIQFPMPVRRVP